jgi:hypothetical protein
MEIQAKIKEVTEQKSKSGKIYWAVETSKGKFSCWDADVADILEEGVGKTMGLEYTEKGNFKNIIGCSWTDLVEEDTKTEPVSNSFRLSYTKDILVAMIDIAGEKFDVLEAAKLAAQCTKVIEEELDKDEKILP